MANVYRASSTEKTNLDHLERVEGQINFARRTPYERAPEAFLPGYDLPPMVTYEVTIHNARPIVNELSLEREGFTLVQHKISCANERNPETMYDRYLEEMVPLIKNYFNASWVVPRRGSVVVRSAGGSSVPGIREPARFAHVDYAPIAAPLLAAIENQLQGIQERTYSRLMIIQTWHALSPPPQDFPLAFCDGASVQHTDLIAIDYTFRHVTFKLCLAHFNPAQRWYYFPEMTADEFILFSCYDSEGHCSSRAAHSAFDNRRAYPNTKPRDSIEARFFVYYV